MTAGDELIDHLLDLLAPLGSFRPKRMFGGWGLFLSDVMVGLVWERRLYLKVDGETRAAFLEAGGQPFIYKPTQRTPMEMGYFTPPDEALESPAAMRPWASLAVGAARRVAAAKKRPTKKKGSMTPATKRASGAAARSQRPRKRG